jgi:hypothetical protein
MGFAYGGREWQGYTPGYTPDDLCTEGYGLWVIADLWVMVCNSLQTKLVDSSSYGI